MLNRRKVTLQEIRKHAKSEGIENAGELGICALVDVDDMGYCEDGKTRWYFFTLRDKNDLCVYYKY